MYQRDLSKEFFCFVFFKQETQNSWKYHILGILWILWNYVTFWIALKFANSEKFSYDSIIRNWKNFPSISFSKKPHYLLLETSFLVNFTNNWSFSMEIDFCAKYWNTISVFCIGGEFCWYCWNVFEVCSMATKTFQADFCAKYW